MGKSMRADAGEGALVCAASRPASILRKQNYLKTGHLKTDMTTELPAG